MIPKMGREALLMGSELEVQLRQTPERITAARAYRHAALP